jgi:quinol monooxygenase YgiN
MLAVAAHHRTAPHAGDFAAAAPARHPAASRAEPGHLPSEASTSIHDPGRFVLYKACTSQDVFQAHRTSTHFAQNAGHAIVPLTFKRDRGRYQPHDHQRGTATLPVSPEPLRDASRHRKHASPETMLTVS